MSLSKEIKKKYNNNISNNTKLSNYSWFNLGGPAEYFFRPDNKNQLIDFLQDNIRNNLKITILGAGSNTLIRDQGIKGVVIKLGKKFAEISLIDKNTIKAGAATLDRKISNFAMENEISSLEFLSCIPGSIGGAVIMNSGCYGYDISHVLSSIDVIDILECKEKEIFKEEIDFYYRGTSLPNHFIITSVNLKGEKGLSKEEIRLKQNDMVEKKKLSQPSQIKTCGSTFKNLSNKKKAWQIIKESGCDKFSEGDAVIWEKHCNFFVNNGNAKSADIEKLINKVKKTVSDKTGVDLELEIKIVGG